MRERVPLLIAAETLHNPFISASNEYNRWRVESDGSHLRLTDMGRFVKQNGRRSVWLSLTFFSLLSIFAGACATKPPANPGAPRANEPLYPVVMTETAERREATLTAWKNFANQQGMPNAPAPDLQPIIATISGLPSSLPMPLHLPKVGAGPTMNEEETRESLRRFITSISPLIGAESQQLSLVQRTDLADGTKKAHYEQKPFLYPLRGDYGVLEITFTPDGRVVQITSTCIPEIDQLRRTAAGIRPHLTADKVPASLADKTFTYTDTAGIKQTLTVAKDEAITVRDLVIYPIPRASDPGTLEFHLAWEVAIGQTLVYLDAVEENTIVAVKQISNQ
ncbi:MAG TPA: hypothetical protein VF779_00090 [Pyrinomonadaceae bacterium]